MGQEISVAVSIAKDTDVTKNGIAKATELRDASGSSNVEVPVLMDIAKEMPIECAMRKEVDVAEKVSVQADPVVEPASPYVD